MPKTKSKKPASRKVLLLMALIRLIFGTLLAISGITILWQYFLLILGTMPSEYQVLLLNYSIPIFGGSVIFIFVYDKEVEAVLNTNV